MYINQIFELSMMLDYERFHQVFKRAYSKAGSMEDEYIDQSMEEKGITIIYRDSQYKKKIRLIVNVGRLLNGGEFDPNRIVRKLNKRIGEYFDYKYRINDFYLSEMRLVADINVDSRENVQAYIKVFQRIGKVKGFSKVSYECFEDIENFCLDGNSNGIELMIYNLERLYGRLFNEDGIGRKRVKEMIKKSEGILRAEVRLVKPKAIRAYIDIDDISKQIMKLSTKGQDIFLETFIRIIPFGDFYKKGKAEEVIWQEVRNNTLKRQMLRLVALIPEKKSLYLAQKMMNCRNIEKVMNAFAKINLSPVTISKRQGVRRLKNIYEYLCE